MIFTHKDLKKILEEEIQKNGFDITKLSEAALNIYNNHDFLEKELGEKLLFIMAMDMGKEFELSEKEFRNFLDKELKDAIISENLKKINQIRPDLKFEDFELIEIESFDDKFECFLLKGTNEAYFPRKNKFINIEKYENKYYLID